MALMPGPDYPGRRPDHHAGRAHRRRLRSRPRQPEGARALEDRGPGARPVAAGRHRAAAGHVVAEGAGRDRGADQSEGQGRQEDAVARAADHQADRARRCSTRCATSRARTRRCAWCSSRSRRTRTRPNSCRCCSRTPALEIVALDQPGDDRRRRPAAPEEPAPDPAASGSSSASSRSAPLAASAAARSTTASTSSKAGSGPAEHRRGDPHHPQSRRAEAGADRRVPPVASGRPRTSSRSACASWRGWRRSRSSRSWPSCASEKATLQDILDSPASMKRADHPARSKPTPSSSATSAAR